MVTIIIRGQKTTIIARAKKTTRITLGFLEMPRNFSNSRINKKNL
jgi:hypothetical protein